ncbi:MAG: TlpA family protein disulfide reductase [Pyrinomonadaceae bacterium]
MQPPFFVKPIKLYVVVMAAGALCLSLSLSGCTLDGKSRASAPVPATPRGSKLPPTAYPMPPIMTAQEAAASNYGWRLLDGRRVGLSDYRGGVVVLDFYGTWCPPCREQTPHLIALQKRYEAQGLNIIGLNVGDEEDKQKVPGYVAELGIQYALGDPDREFSDLFLSDNNSIPQTYVFDRQGRLVKRFIGYDNSMPAQLESVIQSALASEHTE